MVMMAETRDRPEIRFHDEMSAGWETLHRSRTFKARTAAMFGLLGTADLDGQRWLDAGCGTGTLSRLLAARGYGDPEMREFPVFRPHLGVLDWLLLAGSLVLTVAMIAIR